MSAPEHDVSRAVAWQVLAQFWVDTSYDAQELDAFAVRLVRTGLSTRELSRIGYIEVCGAFATFSIAVLLTAGMALPDWEYPEEEARRKVATWLARPRILSWVNPIWLVGYVVALWFFSTEWATLRHRVESYAAPSAV